MADGHAHAHLLRVKESGVAAMVEPPVPYCGSGDVPGFACFSLTEKPPDLRWCRDCIKEWLRENGKDRWPYECHCVVINQDMDKDRSDCWLHSTKEGREWEKADRLHRMQWRISYVEASFVELFERMETIYPFEQHQERSQAWLRLKEARMWFRAESEEGLETTKRIYD